MMTRPPATPAESAMVRDAQAALAAWLDASREPNLSTLPGPAEACDDAMPSFPSPLLAHHVPGTAELRGDTVVARAMVTTVAEQDVDRRSEGRFVARQRVRTDLLEWDVVPTDAGWAVCNGLRFGYRGADSLTRWMPEGASLATARALADSIARAYAEVNAGAATGPATPPATGSHAGAGR
jgi:hypothetical protein